MSTESIKEITIKKEPKQKKTECTILFYKDCMAVTDKEKSEIFKQLLEGNDKSRKRNIKNF